MTNQQPMPYGFKDFTGNVWCDTHVDEYNAYKAKGDDEGATALFHAVLAAFSPGASVKVFG